MSDYTVYFAALNLLLSLYRLYATISKRRLVAVFWFLISYFSLFELLLVIGGTFSRMRGWNAQRIIVDENTIAYVAVYVFVCNTLFAISEMATWRLFGKNCDELTWWIPRDYGIANAFRYVLAPVLLFAAALYAFKMRGLGYTGYVEYKESNWPSVFMGSATPLIAVSMMQRRFLWVVVAMVPFIFFTIQMNIRSFALMSMIPAAIIFVYQLLTDPQYDNKKRTKLLIKSAFIVTLLVFFSGLVTYIKARHFELPDAGLPYGMNLAFQQTMKLKKFTEWNSLQIYSKNILSPFYRLFNIDIPRIVDTPQHIAWLLDGAPPGGRSYYHYPVLWYSDAYVSFGKAGVAMGILWGVLISLTEAVMYRSRILLGLLLPYYIWHWYMICRGATGIATVQIAYCLYITILIFLVVKFLYRNKDSLTHEIT